MALTKDLLKANQALSGLTDEQINVITTLSANDEATQLGTRIGELHGRYDSDVLAVTAIPKAQSEKSYDYVKRVLAEYKTKVEGFAAKETELTSLKQAKTDLEKQLRENAGDAAIKQKLVDTELQLKQLQVQYKTEKETFDADKQKYETKLHSTKVEHQLDQAIANLKFKTSIPESVKSIVINTVKSQLMNEYKTEFEKKADGSESLIFRDQNGILQTNPENALAPFTASDLISNRLKDVLELKKPGAGGGSGKTPNGGGIDTVIDFSSAKTQVAADELIEKHLLSQGLTKLNPEFAVEQQKLRTEINVSKLPLR